MMKKKLVVLVFGLCILFVSAVGASAVTREEREIYDKMLRFHVLANSDGEEDQALKLLVRDAVLDELEESLNVCSSREEAEEVISGLKAKILEIATSVVTKNGYDYPVTLEIVDEYYPTREYDGISLPAGVYRSVKIEIGEAMGKNWWCVLFPQVCTSTAKPSEKLAEVGFTANQIRLLTEQEDTEYVVKFKILEVFSSFFD